MNFPAADGSKAVYILQCAHCSVAGHFAVRSVLYCMFFHSLTVELSQNMRLFQLQRLPFGESSRSSVVSSVTPELLVDKFLV